MRLDQAIGKDDKDNYVVLDANFSRPNDGSGR